MPVSDETILPDVNHLDDTIVVSAQNISKKFCKNLRRSMTYGITDLSKNLLGIRPDSGDLRKDEFWALEDISFNLRKGEVLGIIGLNGSGKSTLLRVLSGIFPPDRGEVKITGRVGALIAVGAGFHPHMTGRENIFLNGTILGMSRREIQNQFNDIVSFAEIGDFLEAPVATYSSGMRVRLGFSIAVHMNPDVTLVDEVLAVGDFNFRQKCSERINELRRRSATIFVSHNMRDILALCSETIVLHQGKVHFQGETEKAVNCYLNLNRGGPRTAGDRCGKDTSLPESTGPQSGVYGELCHNSEKISDVRHQWLDASEKPIGSTAHGEPIMLDFSFRLLKQVNKLIIGVPIYSGGNLMTAANTDARGIHIVVDKSGWVRGRLKIAHMLLNPGTYTPLFAVVDTREFLYRNFTGNFSVREMPFSFGLLTLNQQWDFDSRPASPAF